MMNRHEKWEHSRQFPIGTIFKASLNGVWEPPNNYLEQTDTIRGVFLKLASPSTVIRISPPYTSTSNRMLDSQPDHFTTDYYWSKVEILQIDTDEEEGLE